jgi:hypothetical protein
MNSIESIKTWYGELRTQKGNTVIIRDAQLPSAPTGRMYLYNADRDAIIEYDEAIVDSKLFPLDKDKQKQAEADFGQAWLAAKELFLQLHGKGMPADKQPPEPEVGNINTADDPILDTEDQ